MIFGAVNWTHHRPHFIIPFGESGHLEAHYGWCWYITLIVGVLQLGAGFILHKGHFTKWYEEQEVALADLATAKGFFDASKDALGNDNGEENGKNGGVKVMEIETKID